MNGFFRAAGKGYSIVSHRESDRRAWVEKKIRSDRDAIDNQKVMVFCMRQSRHLEVGIEEVRRVLETKLDFAMNEGMSEATEYINESEASQGTPLRTIPTRIRIAENPIDQKREAFIYFAIREKKKGRAYCDFLGQNKISVPFTWIKDGCPKDYPRAYSIAVWRRQIVQEKNRYSRRLRALEA